MVEPRAVIAALVPVPETSPPCHHTSPPPSVAWYAPNPQQRLILGVAVIVLVLWVWYGSSSTDNGAAGGE
jgi:hypothetical protein